MHNGNAKRGFENPRTKDGRYSPYTGFINDKYLEYRESNDIHSSREEIAIVKALIASSVASLPSREQSIEWFKELRDHVNSSWDAAGRLRKGAELHLIAIRDLVRGGGDMFYRYDELLKLIDSARKLKESDMKTIMNAKLVVPIDEFSHMIREFMTMTRKYLDKESADNILSEFQERFMTDHKNRPEA